MRRDPRLWALNSLELHAMPNNPNAVELLISEREVAGLLGISRWTVKSWRRPGRLSPIPFVRIGRAIRYRLRDVATAVALRAR